MMSFKYFVTSVTFQSNDRHTVVSSRHTIHSPKITTISGSSNFRHAYLNSIHFAKIIYKRMFDVFNDAKNLFCMKTFYTLYKDKGLKAGFLK